MRKQILISLISLSSVLTMNAQWNGTNPVWTTSNVGIGTGYGGVGIISPVEKLTIGEMGGNFAVQDRRTSTTEKYSSGYKFYDYNGESASILLEHNGYFGNGSRALKFIVNGNEGVRIIPNGFVGIGTANPTSKLYVNANDAGDGITLTHPNSRAKVWKLTSGIENYDHHEFSIKNQNGTHFVIDGNGNIGFGTNSPTSKLYVNANDAGDGIILTHPNSRAKVWKLTSGIENYDHHEFSIKNQNGTHFVIDGNGNTGIGTITPGYKLDVCGTIRAKEVKVDLLGTCVPDFVFKKDYKLMNLNELEKFVTTKQHLPEIASEKEMIENGLNMKEFQMKLLQKVEELTLYVIEQNKQIKKQNKQIKKQNKQINKQNIEIRKLKETKKKN